MLTLTPTNAPLRLADHPINLMGDWYRWSREFTDVLIGLSSAIQSLPAPQVISLYGGKPYDHTYTFTEELPDRNLHEALFQSAQSLYRLRVADRLILLTGLFDEAISSETIRYLFAYYHYCLSLISGRRDTAMCAPLGDLSETGFPFPLHADLYLQRFLMIVFDKVPADDSGQTLLIPTGSFLEVIKRLQTMPDAAKLHVLELLTGHTTEDRFDDFFYFLYDKKATWIEELAGALEAQQLMIKFHRGEGFILNDRRWLHGRTTPTGPVQEDRLHRLIFNTLEA